VIGVLFTLAIVAAVLSVAIRRWQRRRAHSPLPGVTIHQPVVVDRFDEIDAAVQGRLCVCEGIYVPVGETSRAIADRRYRIVRLVWRECEREQFMYFDVTQALQ
jgi:hypothetical protein